MLPFTEFDTPAFLLVDIMNKNISCKYNSTPRVLYYMLFSEFQKESWYGPFVPTTIPAKRLLFCLHHYAAIWTHYKIFKILFPWRVFFIFFFISLRISYYWFSFIKPIFSHVRSFRLSHFHFIHFHINLWCYVYSYMVYYEMNGCLISEA